MARKTLLIGSVLAAALLAGCSGTSNDGNASASSSPAATSASATSSSSSSSAPSSSSSSMTSSSATEMTTEMTTEDETTAEDTGSVQPASLDDQSKVWFGTFCTGIGGAVTGMGTAMSGATAAATDPKAEQATYVAAYQQIATAFKDTAGQLDGLPAPTVDNGDKLATDLVAALNQLGDGYNTAAGNFAAAAVTDEASLTAAQAAFATETQQYGEQMQAEFGDLETTLTPELNAAVDQLPECQSMTS